MLPKKLVRTALYGCLMKFSHGGIVNPPCNRKGKNGNPSPTGWRARVLSQQPLTNSQGCTNAKKYALGYELFPPISLCRKPQFNISCACLSYHYPVIASLLQLPTG